MSASSDVSSVDDHPHDSFVPQFGDYFVYALDPLAAVAHLPKDDPAHTEAANLAKTCKQYVAYLHDKNSFAMPEPKHTNIIKIAPLRQGTPPSRGALTDPNMCVPVLPNTSHPFYRPLAPVPPLPWANCYHAFFPYNIEVRATTTWRPHDMVHALSFDERQYFIAIRNEEILKFRAIHEKLPVEVVGPSPPAVLVPGFPMANSNYTTGEHSPKSTVPLDQADHAGGESDNDDARQGHDDPDILTDMVALVGGFVDASLPVVNVWYDLNTVSLVEDPNNFLADYEEMSRIIGEARERINAYQAAQSHNAPRLVTTRPSGWARLWAPVVLSFRRMVRQAGRILRRSKRGHVSTPEVSRSAKNIYCICSTAISCP